MKLADVRSAVAPPPRQTCWDWNAKHVDYGLCPQYRAAVQGRYRTELMPWWREPVNAVCSRAVREVVVVAPTQCGKDEHLACHPLRYWVGTGSNLAVLYVGGQQEKAEEIYVERLKRCLHTTDETEALVAGARERGLVYDVGKVTLVCTWARSGGGLKGRPFDVVLCDETSSWPDVSKVDQARKRGATRPFFKLVVFGSLDPDVPRDTDDDPLWLEFVGSQAAEWMMPDPRTGSLFRFDIGEAGEGPGLKWDTQAKTEDGQWDLNKVESTAFYRTPDGTEIRTETERRDLIRAGRWVPLNPNAPVWRPGFHVHQLMMPWQNVGGFGHIARRLVESVKRGPASHRVFRYEVEAGRWTESASVITDDVLARRVGNYKRGELFAAAPAFAEAYRDAAKIVFMTVDVQKFNFWWTIRQWCIGGDSGLVDYGSAVSWQQLDQIATQYDVPHVLVDVGEGSRNIEFGEACAQFRFIPCKGASVRVPGMYSIHKWNIYEGTSRQREGCTLDLWLHDGQQLKTALYDRITALTPESWRIPTGCGPEYFQQVMSEEWHNGEWRERRQSRGNNHLWDCEVLQLLAASVFGYAVRQLNEPERKS